MIIPILPMRLKLPDSNFYKCTYNWTYYISLQFLNLSKLSVYDKTADKLNNEHNILNILNVDL